MNTRQSLPLLVGEVFRGLHYYCTGVQNKLRLGGVAHAARGFWALGAPFNAAVVMPTYLQDSAKEYFKKLGCVEFYVIGTVMGRRT